MLLALQRCLNLVFSCQDSKALVALNKQDDGEEKRGEDQMGTHETDSKEEEEKKEMKAEDAQAGTECKYKSLHL